MFSGFTGAMAGVVLDPIMFVFIYCALVAGFVAKRHHAMAIVLAIGVAMNLGLSYSMAARIGVPWQIGPALAGAAATVVCMVLAWLVALAAKSLYRRQQHPV